MTTTQKYTTNGALIGGGASALGNTLYQLNKMDKNPELKFDWGQLFKFFAGGAVVGGGIGYIAGNQKEKRIIQESIFNETTFLKELLASNDINNVNPKYLKKAEKIKSFLAQEYNDILASHPDYSGSFSDGSAILSSDIDIKLEFRPNAFQTLEDMYYDVLETVKFNFPDLKVRPQKVSTGLIFQIDNEKFSIDIVPGKRKNELSTDVNLYVNSTTPTRIQTNFHRRNENSSNKSSEIIVLKLMKLLKTSNNLPIKSHHLQLLVQDAFTKNRNNLPHKNIDKLLLTANFIKENIHKRYIVPGNTNNVISESISDSDKQDVIYNIENFLSDFQSSKLAIKKYFQY